MMGTKLKDTLIKIFKSRAIVIIAALVILYTLTGFFLLPFLVERYIPPMLGTSLNCQVSLKDVKTNPFALSLETGEFLMKEDSGMDLAGFKRLYVNLQLSSLFRWAFTFADITIDSPFVNIVIDADGKVNLAGEKGPETVEGKGNPIRLLLHNIGINQGRIDITDNRQSIPARLSFYPLNISLADISTLPDRVGPYTLTATSADGSTLRWSGKVSLQPLHSEGTIAFEQIPLSTPWSFFRSSLNITPPEGMVGLETNYLFDYSEDTPEVLLDSLRVRIADFALRIEGAENTFIDLAQIDLDANNLDLIQQKIEGIGLLIRDGSLDMVTDRDGVLNLQRIDAQKTGAAGESPSPAKTSADKFPWIIDIQSIELEGLSIDYTDQVRPRPVSYTIDDLQLALNAAINTDAPGMQVEVNDLTMTLSRIATGFADASQPVAQAGGLTVIGGALDLGARTASISDIELTDGMIDVIMDSNGALNLAGLFTPGESTQPEVEKAPGEKDGSPWQYMVESASVTGFKTRFTDLAVKQDNPIVELEDINLTVSHFDGRSSSQFEFGVNLAQGGNLTASGRIDPIDTAVTSDITIRDISLPTAQPYLSSVAKDLTLKSGLFSAKGAFNLSANGGISYKGDLLIAELNIVENTTGDTLVGWQELKTPAMKFSLGPNSLEMETLKLAGLEGKFIISEDKTVNVVEAFKTSDRETEEAQPDEPARGMETAGGSFPVKVGRLSLEKGNLYFADLSLRPQFATKIHELMGVIIGISSAPGARTQVELEGRVDEYGSSNIEGEINTFDPKEFTDISVIFQNVEMTNLTPYSGKFAGYKIDSGKLNLDLKYDIEDSQLLGENRIVIDTLTLGEKVESPDAVKLPLKLAVAILKDQDGIIDLDLPVTGNLDDPEFRYSPLIWKALVNLLTKIVTSPFHALGSLLGGGDEIINNVSFEAGSVNVHPQEQEKLLKLIDALRQRPQLRLGITGHYDSISDGEALRELQVRRAVAEAIGMVLEPGEDPGPVDFSDPMSQQKLSDILIERYGQEAYDIPDSGETPSEEGGSTKKKNAEDIEASTEQSPEDASEAANRAFSNLVKREQVEQDALNKLAEKRAQAVATLMIGANGLSQDRIVVKPYEGTDKGNQASVSLDLDAMD